MCQRLDLHDIASIEAAFERFGANSVSNVSFGYNVGAGDRIPLMRFGRNGVESVVARWGSNEYLRYDMGHAGNHGPWIPAESILRLPRLRHMSLTRNCVIAVNAYFAWDYLEGDLESQPFRIASAGHSAPLLLAGIWYPTNRTFPECSIVTTPAEGLLNSVSSRMPAILDAPRARLWMAGGPVSDLEDYLLSPCTDVSVQRVSSAVLDTDNAGENCLHIPSPGEHRRDLLPGKYHQVGLWDDAVA